jgi:hypothetical protein
MSVSTSAALVADRRRRPRRRVLAVSTWLGAGAITIGVGAALAGASGVAQADTGDHHVAGSTSTGKAEARTTAGPKVAARSHPSKITEVASTKRALTTALPLRAAVAKKPSAGPALVNVGGLSTATTNSNTQTISTPFGPIKITSTTTAPDAGTSGPVRISLVATTPVGKANFSLNGSSTFVLGPPATDTVKFTDGKFVVPGPVSFLLDAAGPVVIAANSLLHTGNAFTTALSNGNPIGAAVALLSAGVNLGNAVLFGHTTISLPLGSPTGDPSEPSIQVHIPFGGLFAPLRPLSVTVPGYTYSDSGGLFTGVVEASNFSFQGTQLGGIFPGFLRSFGIG